MPYLNYIKVLELMQAMTGREVLSLYKKLLRESQKFSSYNYREYALRRIKDGFRENKNLENESTISSLYSSASENLEVIKRQVQIGQMYAVNPLVIEKEKGTVR